MDYGRLLALPAIAYIIWWFYALFTWLIPVWNVSWNALTLWTIVGGLVFIIGGGIILIVALIVAGACLLAD